MGCPTRTPRVAHDCGRIPDANDVRAGTASQPPPPSGAPFTVIWTVVSSAWDLPETLADPLGEPFEDPLEAQPVNSCRSRLVGVNVRATPFASWLTTDATSRPPL